MRELSLNNCRLDKRYDVQRRLGCGSYAEIFLARDVLASTQSAHSSAVIKALNVFLQEDPDADLERTLVENFQNEAIALDRVRHPNIISRLGHGTARDLAGTIFHYIVLEYLPGGDIHRLAREQKLSLARTLHYVEQVCAGLRHAHSLGVIHRDIKPQNLLLTKDKETVKIADFGVAKLSHADSPITRVGTNAYAPPEHSPLSAATNGELQRTRLTPAADIYSLAKSIYTLLTGESPRYFANEPVRELPVGVRDEKWARALLPILQRATQSEPSERYQDIESFWTEFSRLREFVDDSAPSLLRRYGANDKPQAQVAPGYSPVAPKQPKFNTSRDLKPRFPAIASAGGRVGTTTGFPLDVHQSGPEIYAAEITSAEPKEIGIVPIDSTNEELIQDTFRSGTLVRKAAVFVILIAGFAGLLYGTHLYLRDAGFLQDIRSPFSQQVATANTDIFLRPSPNTNNEPIGLVTKNSKVRIVNSQNNWYQVDVIEQGRTRPNQDDATRGWLNGRYLDLQ